LSDDCSLEDIQYYLYVIEKVRNGLNAPKPKEPFLKKKLSSDSINGLATDPPSKVFLNHKEAQATQ
jgi:hypothetical protein